MASEEIELLFVVQIVIILHYNNTDLQMGITDSFFRWSSYELNSWLTFDAVLCRTHVTSLQCKLLDIHLPSRKCEKLNL